MILYHVQEIKGMAYTPLVPSLPVVPHTYPQLGFPAHLRKSSSFPLTPNPIQMMKRPQALVHPVPGWYTLLLPVHQALFLLRFDSDHPRSDLVPAVHHNLDRPSHFRIIFPLLSLDQVGHPFPVTSRLMLLLSVCLRLDHRTLLSSRRTGLDPSLRRAPAQVNHLLILRLQKYRRIWVPYLRLV